MLEMSHDKVNGGYLSSQTHLSDLQCGSSPGSQLKIMLSPGKWTTISRRRIRTQNSLVSKL